jgi:hypothetical protein
VSFRPAKKHLKNGWGGNVEVSCGRELRQNELNYRSSCTDKLIRAALPIDYVRVSPASRWRNNMTMLKSVIVAAALVACGISLAIAQNGPRTRGEHPVAGGAAGDGWGWYGDGWYGGEPYSYAYHPRLNVYYPDRHQMAPTVPPNH